MKIKRSAAIDIAVGARIRNLRLRNRLSQTELGEQIGVTFQQIQKYEKGTNRVAAGRLAEFSKIFGLPVAAFYSEVPNGEAKQRKKTKLDSGADSNTVRLMRAFQALRDKRLKAALLRAAEVMVGRQNSRKRA
jgi:transcriptional regulator with XRE-family HTH domain